MGSTHWTSGSALAQGLGPLLSNCYPALKSPFYGLRPRVLEDKQLDVTLEKETRASLEVTCGPAKEFGLYFEHNEKSLIFYVVARS